MSSRDLSGRPKGDIGAGVSGGSGEQRRAQRAAAGAESSGGRREQRQQSNAKNGIGQGRPGARLTVRRHAQDAHVAGMEVAVNEIVVKHHLEEELDTTARHLLARLDVAVEKLQMGQARLAGRHGVQGWRAEVACKGGAQGQRPSRPSRPSGPSGPSGLLPC